MNRPARVEGDTHREKDRAGRRHSEKARKTPTLTEPLPQSL